MIDIKAEEKFQERIKDRQNDIFYYFNYGEDNGMRDYEDLLIKAENDIRGHIKEEQELKIRIEDLERRLEELEKENISLKNELLKSNRSLSNSRMTSASKGKNFRSFFNNTSHNDYFENDNTLRNINFLQRENERLKKMVSSYQMKYEKFSKEEKKVKLNISQQDILKEKIHRKKQFSEEIGNKLITNSANTSLLSPPLPRNGNLNSLLDESNVNKTVATGASFKFSPQTEDTTQSNNEGRLITQPTPKKDKFKDSVEKINYKTIFFRNSKNKVNSHYLKTNSSAQQSPKATTNKKINKKNLTMKTINENKDISIQRKISSYRDTSSSYHCNTQNKSLVKDKKPIETSFLKRSTVFNETMRRNSIKKVKKNNNIMGSSGNMVQSNSDKFFKNVKVKQKTASLNFVTEKKPNVIINNFNNYNYINVFPHPNNPGHQKTNSKSKLIFGKKNNKKQLTSSIPKEKK